MRLPLCERILLEDELEANRKILGGVRLFKPPSFAVPFSSCSNSSIPSPPFLRHKRATRSAVSRTLTNRTAPASSTARDDFKRKMRIVGNLPSWAP